jgi:hypothetical protein
MRPQFVTITGVDDRTDMDRLASISRRWPIEWAVLHWPQGQGVQPRFPSASTIDALFDAAADCGARLAAHLCGAHAKAVMAGTLDRHALLLDAYDRVQVNHVRPDVEALRVLAGGHPAVIAQWRDPASFPAETSANLWLYDPSGGRGVAPSAWPVNPTSSPVGFAGGIRPDNVAAVVEAVRHLSPAGYWLDMETGVRTDDWLDLDLVERVLATVYG